MRLSKAFCDMCGMEQDRNSSLNHMVIRGEGQEICDECEEEIAEKIEKAVPYQVWGFKEVHEIYEYADPKVKEKYGGKE